MTERLTYWKCSHCHGTGKVIRGCRDWEQAFSCDHCDGTGNAFVDGETERHKRRLAQLDWPEVTKEQVDKIDRLVAPAFATGDWQPVEQER